MTDNGEVAIVRIDIDALACAIAARLPAVQGGSPWLSIQEAADWLGVSYQWLFQRLSEIPHRRFGANGRVLIHRDELDEWTRRYMR